MFPTPRLQTLIERGIGEGLHIGAQVSASIDGERAIDLAVGQSRFGVAMTTDTLMIWLSASKPIGAVAIARLWERGLLGLDDPVATFIPEFAANDKSAVTIRHCLTHTAGLRAAASHWTRDSWEYTIDKICQSKLEPGWTPGEKAGYHVASTWFLLGEIVRRIDGRPYDQYVRDDIFLPLDMTDCYLAMPEHVYASYGDRMAVMQNTEGDAKPQTWDTPEVATLCKPGGSGRGPVRQLLRFYEMLLNGGSLDGVQIITPQTVEALTARHRIGMFDETFKHNMDWGLGFIPNNRWHGPDTVRYGYGPHAHYRTFGHGGHQSSVAFADPHHGLAVALTFNGTPGEAKHDRRLRETLGTIYEELGLA